MIRKVLVTLFLLFLALPVSAAEHVAGGSAVIQNLPHGPIAQKMSYRDFVMESNSKKRAIKSILEKSGSPMAGSVDTFLHTCDQYELDCYLLPAITGLESGFGHYILQGSYNPFGWDGGYAYFNNWDHAIQTVGAGIQERYINYGAQTIEQIGSKYAASPTWASRVRGYISDFEGEEKKNSLYLSDLDLQL